MLIPTSLPINTIAEMIEPRQDDIPRYIDTNLPVNVIIRLNYRPGGDSQSQQTF